MAYYQPYQTVYDYAAFSTFPGHSYYQNGSYEQQELLRRHVAMMNQGMMQGSGGKATESKPRLAKDEVDKLEREFQRNNKPNSSLKKQLAEEMRVDIARINNWFQNRRAKAKQEKRAQENEARRKSEQDAESAAATTSALDTVKEYYPSNDHDDDLRPSAAPFPPVNASADTPSGHESLSTDGIETKDCFEEKQCATESAESEYASPDSTSTGFQPPSLNITYDWAVDDYFAGHACDFSSSLPSEADNQAPCLTLSIPSEYMSQISDSASVSSMSSYQHLSGPADVDETLASHYLPQSLSDSVHLNIKPEQIQTEDMHRFDHTSPESIPYSPPEITTPDFPFKSPSTIDIASRRKSKRPAQLVSCMRSQSYNLSGPKTGMEMSRRMEAPSPMRRVASATSGNFPRGIQKPISAGPRSPLYFDRSRENLILQMAAHSPVSRGSVAPPTPNTPVVPNQQGLREATVSSMSSDEDKTYSVQNNLTVPQYAMDPTMRTPPDTPGLMTNMSSLFPTFDFNVPDDPLHTPGFGTFDQDFPGLSNSVPGYVAHECASQPVTPSFAPSNMGPALHGSSYGGGSIEYNWSESSAVSANPSPEPSRSRQFQFTNMTAQDFHGE